MKLFRSVQRPSPAMVVALIALFVALGGTAGAVTYAAVPLAKRALSADVAKDAKKLEGQKAAEIVAEAAAVPGPASTAAGLLTWKTTIIKLAPNEHDTFVIQCDSGVIVSGGRQATSSVLGLEQLPP